MQNGLVDLANRYSSSLLENMISLLFLVFITFKNPSVLKHSSVNPILHTVFFLVE